MVNSDHIYRGPRCIWALNAFRSAVCFDLCIVCSHCVLRSLELWPSVWIWLCSRPRWMPEMRVCWSMWGKPWPLVQDLVMRSRCLLISSTLPCEKIITENKWIVLNTPTPENILAIFNVWLVRRFDINVTSLFLWTELEHFLHFQSHRCQEGYECNVQHVQCVADPCPPAQAVCVPSKPFLSLWKIIHFY